METFKIDYLNNYTELCEMGRKYDTDKSALRDNITDSRHCHPYTIFYHGLFKNRRNDVLNIAEIGILDGASLRMWQEYFPNANIYGFDNNIDFINNFKNNYNNDRIKLYQIDVTNENDIKNTLQEFNDIKFDIIIEDSTHQFNDQIRVIKNVSDYLKPGGLLIIEDIFKSYNENNYMEELKEELKLFQDYYFIELDSVKRNSTGWNNDKLFVLTKNGDEPIFKNNNKITIITPCSRPQNLNKLKESINFDYVDEWIIIYDAGKINIHPELFKENDKIKEYICYDSRSIVGNAQRNYGLDRIQNKDTLLYYLDDDNQIHPNLYKLLTIIDNDKLYYFNQLRVKEANPYFKPYDNGSCDSAMFIIPFNICNDIRWILHEYCADSFYIVECYERNKNKRVNVDNYLCYHNIL